MSEVELALLFPLSLAWFVLIRF